MDVYKKIEQINSSKKNIEDASVSVGQGKSARERIDMLFDEGTFVEVGAFVKQRPTEFGKVDVAAEGVITGYGAVNGRLVFVFSQDMASLKGSISEMHAAKIVNIIEMAKKVKAPIISMIDSCGLRLNEGIDALAGYGRIFNAINSIRKTNLHICMVMGTSAGTLSFLPAVADYSVIVRGAELFLNPPDVLFAQFGKTGTGTAEEAWKNGVVTAVASDEEDAVIRSKLFIEMVCGCQDPTVDPNILTPSIADKLSCPMFKINDLIHLIADEDKVLAMLKGYAQNIITDLIRLNGRTVGVIANNTLVLGGKLTSAACDKASRFIHFCNSHAIPIVSLVDTEGYAPEEEERIGDCSKLMSAYMNASVPKVTLYVGKVCGAGFVSMCSKTTGADIVYAYPTSSVSVLPAITGAVFTYDQKIAQSDNPIKTREDAIKEYTEIMSSPMEAAKRGYIDDIIDPLTTRQLLIAAVEMLEGKK